MRKHKDAPQCNHHLKICYVSINYHHHRRLPEQMLYRYSLSQTGSSTSKLTGWNKMINHLHRHLWAGMFTKTRICAVLSLSLSQQTGKVCTVAPWRSML